MIQLDNKQDLDEQLGKSKRVLALFYASWCPYCIRFVPIFKKKTADFKEVTILEVLLDDYDNPLWDDYTIGAVPTAILFEDSRVCSRLDGKPGIGLSEKQIVTWLDKEF